MKKNFKIIQNVEFNKQIVSFLIFENEWLTREQQRVEIHLIFSTKTTSREISYFINDKEF